MDELLNLEVVPVEALSPGAQRFVGIGAPDAARMMAARGLAPLVPKDMCGVLASLASDRSEAVAKAARDSIAALPDRILDPAMQDRLHPSILHIFVRLLGADCRWAEAIIANPATHDDTILWLSQKSVDERHLEIIATQETRLLRLPKIIEAMYLNARTRMSTVDRLMEFAVRNGLDLSGIPAFKEAQAAILGIKDLPPTEPEEVAPEAQAPTPQAPPVANVPPVVLSTRPLAGPAVWGGRTPVVPGAAGSPVTAVGGAPMEPVLLQPIDAIEALSEDEIHALADDGPEEEDLLSADEAADELKKKGANIQALLLKMTASQRVRWAQIGNKEVRNYLMRDSNKMVASAAIKNPRVTEQELITVALSRSVNDEVVRVIGSSRDWTKNYQVRLNLCNNPKCPLPTALRFLRTLRASDVKALAKNKNVSTAVSTAARRLTAQSETKGA